MPQSILWVANRSGTEPQVYRVVGATPAALGDPLPTTSVVETGTALDDCFFANRAIQFRNNVYAAAVDGVYRKNDALTLGGPWSQVHAFTNMAAPGQDFHIHGPYQIVVGAVPMLYVIWPANASNTSWNASLLNGNTGLWSDVGVQVSVSHATDQVFSKPIVYRNVIYIPYSGGILTFDPGAGTFGNVALGALESPANAGVCVFNDRLLLIGRESGAGNLALFEIVSGSIVKLIDVTGFTTTHAAGATEHKHVLTPSPTGQFLYAVVNTAQGGIGSSFLKFIDTAGTISLDSDITNPVVPASLRPGSGAITNRWSAFYDQETTPGTAALQLFFSADGAVGSTVTSYRFVDEATVLTNEDTGASAGWALVESTVGGGERIFTPGELHIELVENLAVSTGEALRFIAWGDPGAVDKNVEIYFNTQSEVPLAPITLLGPPVVVSGPAATPTLNGGLNRLEDVEADGVSIYEIVWDIVADGVGRGDRAQLVPRIYVD